MRYQLRLYFALLLTLSAVTTSAGLAKSTTVNLRRGAEHLLTPAPKEYRAEVTETGEARLFRGGKVVQSTNAGKSSLLPNGFSLTQKLQLSRRGKVVATLGLNHDLKDDAFWGDRKLANSLRYHQGRGGVYPEITRVMAESKKAALIVVSWRSVSLSANTPLVHQVVRLGLDDSISATVLASFDAKYEWPYLFIQEGKTLLYHDESLYQIVPRGRR